MTVRVFSDLSDLSAAAAQEISDDLVEAIFDRKKATLALAGGQTPRQAYALLAESENVDWDRVEIYFGDERAVPPTHPESNFQMASEELIDRLPAAPLAVHRMEADRQHLAQAAADYAALLPDALDVLVLGVGSDGHTASLFPDDPALYAPARVVLVQSPKPPYGRLTITPRVIEAARSIVVVVSGEDKADAVFRALEGEPDFASTPAQLARRGKWLVDEAAARLLKAVERS